VTLAAFSLTGLQLYPLVSASAADAVVSIDARNTAPLDETQSSGPPVS